jgi:hypothetical protein
MTHKSEEILSAECSTSASGSVPKCLGSATLVPSLVDNIIVDYVDTGDKVLAGVKNTGDKFCSDFLFFK